MVWLYKRQEKRAKCDDFSGNACSVYKSDNMMPDLSNVATTKDGKNLDTGREKSSIPRADRNENWMYPSPMQFYNALLLKNKANKQEAQYMRDAVRAHNCVNEQSWEKVVEWENMHKDTCARPELRRFIGRYEDRSPKSYLMSLFTRFNAPFDRHDWYVNRCGKEIRYIIDYYDDPLKQDDIQVHIDARPALDSLGNAYDRLRRLLSRLQPS